MTRRFGLISLVFFCCSGWLSAGNEASRPLLRFPDIDGDPVAFVHAEDIGIAPVSGGSALRLTDDEGEDRLPMWVGTELYFASDRDGLLDLYRYDLSNGAVERVTQHRQGDVRRPTAVGSFTNRAGTIPGPVRPGVSTFRSPRPPFPRTAGDDVR